MKALLGGKAGECYSYGKFVGRVKAGGRRFGIGRATYWAAYTNDGRLLGSCYSAREAEALVFGWWANVDAVSARCPYTY